VAEACTAGALAEALRRALATPPPARERMGEAAACAVRRHCDNDAVISRHLDLKRALARVPARYCRPGSRTTSSGTVVVSSSLAQSIATASLVSAAGGQPPGVIALVDPHLSLSDNALAVVADLFDRDPGLGIVSGWIHQTHPIEQVQLPPVPSTPYLWGQGRIAPFVAVRTAALLARQSDNGRPEPDATLDVFDRLVQDGWTAVVYPAVLGTLAGVAAAPQQASRYSAMARGIRRHHTPLMRLFLDSADERRAVVRDVMSDPARTLGHVMRRLLGAQLS
jgi:hypothetical protein